MDEFNFKCSFNIRILFYFFEKLIAVDDSIRKKFYSLNIAGDYQLIKNEAGKFINKRVQQDGILAEIRRHEYYEKPSVKRKRKEAAKRRKTSTRS